MAGILVNTIKDWSFTTHRSILAFSLLRQIVRQFEENCETVLDEEDQEIEYMLDVLKGLLPESQKFLDKKFDKKDIAANKSLTDIYSIAEQCLEDPVKAVEFSIHNSLNYFLEDCGEMPELEPEEIKAKVIRFFFPDIHMPEDNLTSFFTQIDKDYKEQEEKKLETVYLHRTCKFLDDILELRYLVS